MSSVVKFQFSFARRSGASFEAIAQLALRASFDIILPYDILPDASAHNDEHRMQLNVTSIRASRPRIAEKLSPALNASESITSHFPAKFYIHIKLRDFHTSLLVKSILVALALLLPVSQVSAARIEVGDDCTLAQAINEANGETTGVGSCLAGDDGAGDPGHDTIVLPAGGADYVLGSALPSIDSSITIEGNGNTISGGDAFRIFFVLEDAVMTIKNLIMINGDGGSLGGGAIRAINARLTLNGSVVRDSSVSSESGGGIYISGHGFDPAWLTITGSSIHGNSAGQDGGGIYVNGAVDVDIRKSSIYSNSAGAAGGGIALRPADGGNSIGMRNSSIFGNSAETFGGGIYLFSNTTGNSPDIALYHLTVTGNSAKSASEDKGGGVYISLRAADLSLRNNIIAGNSNQNCYLPTVSLVNLTLRDNIIAGDSTSACTTGQLDSDPRLASRATGNPPYFALLAGSPAIDAADCLAGISTDQRGARRRQGRRCDIGAYESAEEAASGDDYQAASAGREEAASEDDDESGASSYREVVRISPTQTCLNLAPAVVLSNLSGGTSCQLVPPVGYGHPELFAAKPLLVVDVWGWVTPNTQICFRAASGFLKFVDTAILPRTLGDLPVFSVEGMVCAKIAGPGQVALTPGPPPPLPQDLRDGSRRLSGCMVTVGTSLRFRETPGGKFVAGVAKGWFLTAVARTDDWFKVDRYGRKGWISADFVEPEGNCG